MPNFTIQPCPEHGIASWQVNSQSCILCGTYKRTVEQQDITSIEKDIDAEIATLKARTDYLESLKRHVIPALRKNPPQRPTQRVYMDAGFGAVPVDVPAYDDEDDDFDWC